MTAEQAQDWSDRFGKDVKQISAAAALRSFEETSEGVDAVFDLTMTLTPDRAPPMDFRIVASASLVNQGGGWKISRLVERGQ
jgi:hypothetical protein